MSMLHKDSPVRLPSSLLTAFCAAVALSASLAAPLPAQVPADAVLSGFEPTGDFLLEVDGEDVAKAEIYHSQRAGAYLILTSRFASPVLLNIRAGQVESVHVMKVAKRPDGRIDLLADATLEPLGAFRFSDGRVTFTVEGQQARLQPKPPLTGSRQADDLLEHSPGYALGMQRFEPNGPAMAKLDTEEQPVRVRVFFGSWCSVCKRHLPSLLKVERELADSGISFDYYGLPKAPAAWEDPEVVRLGVKSVPTAIVYRGDRELGRITGQQWNRPEVRLSAILAGAAAPGGR